MEYYRKHRLAASTAAAIEESEVLCEKLTIYTALTVRDQEGVDRAVAYLKENNLHAEVGLAGKFIVIKTNGQYHYI